MTSRRDDDAQDDLFHPDSAMDEVFARANPNPERKDCPSDDVLRELAARQRAISDPAYEHLAQCSPCYRAFRMFQRQQSAAPRRRAAGYHPWLTTAAAVVLAVAGIWWFTSRSVIDVTVDPAELRAEMDLRKYALDRGEATPPAEPPLSALPARLDLTILLPVGSDAGSYELQVMDSALRSHRSTEGEARIENFVTTLRARIDLRGLAPGDYNLAIRRHGADWRLFPLHVK